MSTSQALDRAAGDLPSGTQTPRLYPDRPSAAPTTTAAPTTAPRATATKTPSAAAKRQATEARPAVDSASDEVAPEEVGDRAVSGWRLKWADEFSAGELDTSKWDAEHESTYGDGNKELACLLDRDQNLRLDNGELVLTARKEARPFACGEDDGRFPGGRTYTSAHLTTRDTASWTYGRFEMRAKLPTQAGTSQGIWPAFWLRPTTGGTGELDVMEAVGSDSSSDEWKRVHQTIHYDYKPTYPFQAMNYKMTGGSPADGFHTYAAEWEPGVIRWYIDGKLTYTRDRSTTPWLDRAFNKPFYLRLNLAVGGEWPGSPNAATRFPSEYRVDYVRVYQR